MSIEGEVQDRAAEDVDLDRILSNAKTVAVVGLSPKKDNPSYEVARI